MNPDISKHAGPGEFVSTRNKKLLDHQKLYVNNILDATGDLGNVFYDIMNEIGNGRAPNLWREQGLVNGIWESRDACLFYWAFGF